MMGYYVLELVLTEGERGLIRGGQNRRTQDEQTASQLESGAAWLRSSGER